MGEENIIPEILSAQWETYINRYFGISIFKTGRMEGLHSWELNAMNPYTKKAKVRNKFIINPFWKWSSYCWLYPRLLNGSRYVLLRLLSGIRDWANVSLPNSLITKGAGRMAPNNHRSSTRVLHYLFMYERARYGILCLFMVSVPNTGCVCPIQLITREKHVSCN